MLFAHLNGILRLLTDCAFAARVEHSSEFTLAAIAQTRGG